MSNEKISKFLSYVLRHKPDSINLQLDKEGWANVDELISKAKMQKYHFTYEQLVDVVRSCEKQRYTLDDVNRRIRANQGHSINVDVGLVEKTPPTILYHGTATRFSEAIEKEGLKPMSRQHVHLSADLETAAVVGKRHGKLIIYEVDVAQMVKEGFHFYQSENGVWLTGLVQPKFLKRHE